MSDGNGNSSVSNAVLQLLEEQKREWPVVGQRFASLGRLQVKTFALSRLCHVMVQFNPERIRSSKADISPGALAKRPCFLCPAGRDPLQRTFRLGDYGVQVNPFPVFPAHFTVTYKAHVPQKIIGRFGDYLAILQALDQLTVFYNGPHCGASAPDHCHFQACTRGIMPVEREWRHCPLETVTEAGGARLLRVKEYFRTLLVLQGDSPAAVERLFDKWSASLPVQPGEYEPRMNLIGFYNEGLYTVLLLPRDRLRPACFYASDSGQRTISPASVEMGGLFITPVEKDFRSLSVPEIKEILHECTLKI